MPLPNTRTKESVLRPVHPNAGIEAEYRRRLVGLIDEMHRSVLYWLKAAYRANEPEISQDESPAVAMRASMRKLRRRWLARFDEASKELAAYFGTAVSERSDAALRAALKKGGLSVEFKMTRAQNDVARATIGQNVSLIKSIPHDYLAKVEGHVMRSVQTGRDLGTLTKALENEFGVTKRRAAFIAKDQNNKATAALTRARQIEIGVTEAVWLHSGGGKHPRPAHVAASGKRYDIAKGMMIGGKYIFPGELPNCRCVSRSVIKGFS